MFVSVIVLKRTFFFLIALFDNSAIPMWICIMSSRSNSANVCHAHLTDRIFFFVRKHTCNAYILDQFLSLFMLESVFRYQYG